MNQYSLLHPKLVHCVASLSLQRKMFGIPLLTSNFAVAMKTANKTYESEAVEELVDIDSPFHLIVWNDDVNTFDWVIETLMEVCHHDYEQAEQCAYIIHFKGKYAVKHGSYDELKPICDAITERGIGATVETVLA